MVTKRRTDIEELVREDRVHHRVYGDPEIFPEEMQRIIERTLNT